MPTSRSHVWSDPKRRRRPLRAPAPEPEPNHGTPRPTRTPNWQPPTSNHHKGRSSTIVQATRLSSGPPWSLACASRTQGSRNSFQRPLAELRPRRGSLRRIDAYTSTGAQWPACGLQRCFHGPSCFGRAKGGVRPGRGGASYPWSQTAVAKGARHLSATAVASFRGVQRPRGEFVHTLIASRP